ncbi:MAG: sugar ABC transporter permease [Propionibacterium sp.]|nr:sugar ABC transporter permease [Propionibacterium sp.]
MGRAPAGIERRQRIAGRWLLSPALVVLSLTTIVPMLFAAFLSFTKYDLLSAPRFVGLANYVQLLTDPTFGTAVANTLEFALGQVVIGIVVAFFIAMLFNNPLVGGGLMRTMIYVPQAMSYVTVALLWSFLYDPFVGPIDAALRAAGLPTVNFLTDANAAMPSILGMSLWRNLGYFSIILLAGLKAVPGELIEAAKIDHAGWWARTRHVVIPSMRNTLLFVGVTWFMGGLQMFTQAYVMTQGGPGDATRTVVYDMYQSAFTDLNIGRASAIAVLLFLVVVLVALPARLVQEIQSRRAARA